MDDEDGRLVWMLTRGVISPAARSADRFAGVHGVMRKDASTISPEAGLFSDGARVLQEGGIRAFPVVQDGELVAMLTVDDIGRAALLNGEGREKPRR